MALPKAIQRQVEEADRLVDTLAGTKPEGQEGEPPETDPPDVTNQGDPPQDPPPAAPPQPVSQEPAVTPPQPQDDSWLTKYHALKGKYDAEVPRLHAELREMKAQMQQLIADKAAAEAKVAKPQEPQKTLITEQDREAFGPDLIDLIERAAESKISGYSQREVELVNEIKTLKQELASVSERQGISDKDRFLMGLGQRVADWETLNVDAGFLNWLQEVDPVYGAPRQAALTSAYEVLDVDRVARIFNAYKQTLAPAPQQQPQQQKPNLQRQVAPTRSRSTTPPAASAPNQRIFTQQEITQFYDEWRRGFIDNDEAAQMEKEIAAAAAQGRVR